MTPADLSKALGIPLSDEGAKRLCSALVAAVDASFGRKETATREEPTEDEIKLRVNKCYDLIKRLIKDHNWSTIKTADHLERYLRCELLGISYTPSNFQQGWGKQG